MMIMMMMPDLNLSQLFNQPMVEHELAVSLSPAIIPLSTAFILLFLSALSLPSPGILPILFRLSLLPFLFRLAYDILLNRDYSFGSTMRDTAFPSLAFIIIFRALDFSVINLWDPERAPHWIVPDHTTETTHSNSKSKLNPPEPTDHDPKTSNPKDGSSAQVKNLDVPPPDRDRVLSQRWKKVPYPPLFSFDRMLWALDNLISLRPGTPWIFPWRLRALSWSQRVLESPTTPWAIPEWPLIPAIIQQVAHLGCHTYIRHLDLDSSKTLWDEPLYRQILLTFALGGIVSFGNALEEAILFPIFTYLNVVPPTALIANSRRTILSSGLVDLWGKRWHHVWRRSYIRLARLLPGANNPLIHAFGTFYISAAMHCILLARVYPIPNLEDPKTLIPLIFEPGVMIFFLCQGAGMIIERVMIPVRPNDRWTTNLLRRCWLYFVLIGSGRYVTNSLVVKGLMRKKEWDMLNWSVVMRMLLGLVWPTYSIPT